MREKKIHYFQMIEIEKQRRALCDWLYDGTSPYYWIIVDEVEKVTCKNCLKILAAKVGLVRDTPAGIISDKMKEMKNG